MLLTNYWDVLLQLFALLEGVLPAYGVWGQLWIFFSCATNLPKHNA